MVMFPENQYDPKEHARLLDAMLGKAPPEDEINLIEGDEDTIELRAIPDAEPKQ